MDKNLSVCFIKTVNLNNNQENKIEIFIFILIACFNILNLLYGPSPKKSNAMYLLANPVYSFSISNDISPIVYFSLFSRSGNTMRIALLITNSRTDRNAEMAK